MRMLSIDNILHNFLQHGRTEAAPYGAYKLVRPMKGVITEPVRRTIWRVHHNFGKELTSQIGSPHPADVGINAYQAISGKFGFITAPHLCDGVVHPGIGIFPTLRLACQGFQDDGSLVNLVIRPPIIEAMSGQEE